MYIILSMILSGNILLIVFFAFKNLLTKYSDYRLQSKILKMCLFFFVIPLSLINGLTRLLCYKLFGTNPSPLYHLKGVNPTIVFTPDNIVTNPAIHTTAIVFAIWLILACILCGYYICSYLRFKKIVYASAKSIHTDFLCSFLTEQANALKIKRNIRLFESNGLESALTIGIIRPVIFLPVDYNNTELKIMILHELKHIKNHDMATKLLCLLCKGLYWFNPFIYLLSHFLNQIAELACDEWVAQQLDVNQKPLYASLIITMSRKKTALYKYSALFTGNYEFIQERIDCIMNKTQKNKMRQLLSMIISMIVIVLSSIPAFAAPPLQLLTVNSAPPEAISYESGHNGLFYLGTVDFDQEQGCTIVYDRQFTTLDGIIYDATDAESHSTFNCDHDYEDGTYTLHKQNDDGGCTTDYYYAQQCRLCGDYTIGEKFNELTFSNCPH